MGASQQEESDQPRLSRPARLLAALAVAFSTFALAHLFFVPVFGSNDDVSLEMLARGSGVVAEPTPHLLFVNILLGKFLNLLYQTIPGISWYRAVMTGIHLAGSTVIAFVALSRRLSFSRLVLILAYFAVFDFHYYVHPHFTITAAIPAEAAVLLWADYAARRQALGIGGLAVFLGLWLLSGLVRYEAYMLVMLLAVPCVIAYSAQAWCDTSAPFRTKMRALIATTAVPFLGAAILVEGARAHNAWAYATAPGWEDFYEFNLMRAQFTDYGRAGYDDATRPVFDEIGWSENDDVMLRNWFFANRDLYNRQTFRRLLDAFPAGNSYLAVWMFLELIQGVAENLPFKMVVVAAFLPLFLVAGRQAARCTIAFSLVGAAVVCFLLLVFVRRFPPSVYIPLFGFVPCLALAMPTESFRFRQPDRPYLWLQIGWSLLLLALAADSISRLRAESESAQFMHDNLREALARLHHRSDQLYVVWGGLFPFELLLTDADFEELKDFNMLPLGFLTQSPVFEARMRQFGIDDVYRAIFENPKVYLIASDRLNKFFIEYVREHYGKEIAPDCLLEVDLAKGVGYEFSTRQRYTAPYKFAVYKFSEGTPDDGDFSHPKP